MDIQIITSKKELKQLVRDGFIFQFCIAFALNKGFKDAMKEKKEVAFSVGDYDVVFEPDSMCFTLSHKIYLGKMMTAYYNGTVFIGDSEEDLITEILTELEKELTV